MTKREAVRQTEQERTLIALGFTTDEAESLRRISIRLHRWHELECGTDSACLVRGTWDRESQSFNYDDNGSPYFEFAGGSGRNRYQPTRDLETGAKRRLDAIIKARNERDAVALSLQQVLDRRGAVRAYIQTDPRGAALYILRPGDVPDGQAVESYYNRGICVY
ncbi:MAG: hypothetical protein NUW01_06620 [Gemmatimonadaceae bacterium]|nr:hypothetical protein [Gemmatimonadaceae bacterium]